MKGDWGLKARRINYKRGSLGGTRGGWLCSEDAQPQAYLHALTARRRDDKSSPPMVHDWLHTRPGTRDSVSRVHAFALGPMMSAQPFFPSHLLCKDANRLT
jgi:hypothetical protein